MNILAFGEILWDVIENQKYLGGAPFNFAAHSAQCGAQAYMVTRLGNDALGDEAIHQASKHHVHTDFIQHDVRHDTGIVNVTLQNGQPDYIINTNAAYDFIEYDGAIEKIEFDIFYYGTLAQRNVVSAHTLQQIVRSNTFKHIFCDVNLRKDCYTETSVKESLAMCTILKLNIDEVPVISQCLFGEADSMVVFCCRVYADYGIKTIIITAADQGCYVYTNKIITHIPAQVVRVADAVGAGDAFSAAFMYIFLKHHDVVKAATVANQVGGFVASMQGAIPVYTPAIQQVLTSC